MMTMLVAIVAPSFLRVAEMSRSAFCKNQMHHIGLVLLVEGAEAKDLQHNIGITVPDSSRWQASLVEVNLLDLIICPSDREPPSDPFAGLKNLYFHQSSTEGGHYGEFDTSLYDMMRGLQPPDKQVSYMYQGNAYVGHYYDSKGFSWSEYLATIGGALADNQMLMTAGSGAIVVTFHATYLEIVEYDPRPEWTAEYGSQIGSDHYLWQGPSDNWQDNIIRQFVGKSNLEVAKAFVNFSKVSYGMNSLVKNTHPSLNQICLIEYNVPEINLHRPAIDQPFDDQTDNGEIMARHLGKANVLTVDGKVRSMTKDDLKAQYDDPRGSFHP